MAFSLFADLQSFVFDYLEASLVETAVFQTSSVTEKLVGVTDSLQIGSF